MHIVHPYSKENDRRRWERTALKEGCLIFESNGALAEVFDISQSGIGLQSIYSLPETGHFAKDGLLFCQGVLLENLSFRIVSSALLPKDNEFSTLVKRRYGLLFGNLTESQKSKIDNIIKTCRTV